MYSDPLYGALRLNRLMQQLVRAKLADGFLHLKKPFLIGTYLLYRNNQSKKSMVIMGKKFEDYLEFQVHRQNAISAMVLKGCQLLYSIQTKRLAKEQYFGAWRKATRKNGNLTKHNVRYKIFECKMRMLCEIPYWRLKHVFLLIKYHSKNNLQYVYRKALLERLVATLNNYEIRILHFHFLDKNNHIQSFSSLKEAKRIAFNKLSQLSGTKSQIHHYSKKKGVILLFGCLSTILSKKYCYAIESVRYDLLTRPINPYEYQCPSSNLSKFFLNSLQNVIYKYTYVVGFRMIRQKAAKVKWEAQEILAMTLRHCFNGLFRLFVQKRKEMLRNCFKHIKRYVSKMSAERRIGDQSFVYVAKAGLQVTVSRIMMYGPIIAEKARKLELRPTNGICLKIRILDQTITFLFKKTLRRAFSMIQDDASMPSNSVEYLLNNIYVLSKEVVSSVHYLVSFNPRHLIFYFALVLQLNSLVATLNSKDSRYSHHYYHMDIEIDSLHDHMMGSHSNFDHLRNELMSLTSRAMEIMTVLTSEFDISFNPLKTVPEAKKSLYKCRYCGRQFESPCSVGGHVSQMHSIQAKNIAKKTKLAKVKIESAAQYWGHRNPS